MQSHRQEGQAGDSRDDSAPTDPDSRQNTRQEEHPAEEKIDGKIERHGLHQARQEERSANADEDDRDSAHRDPSTTRVFRISSAFIRLISPLLNSTSRSLPKMPGSHASGVDPRSAV